MTENNKKRLNLPFILPLLLLIVEIVVVLVLQGTGYEISDFSYVFLLFLGFFLIYQITRQFWMEWRIKKAMLGLKIAEELTAADKPMEAIKQWKAILLNLPEEYYLDTLSKIEEVYESQNMTKAVQQIKNIQSESIEFFELTRTAQRITLEKRGEWQSRVFELHKMIESLPVEKEQDLNKIQNKN